ADLRRYLRGEPIRARPVGRLEKAWRWTRRNPWVAGLSATVAVLLVALAAGSVAAALVFRHQRDAEAEARRQAVEARQQADHNAEMAQTAQAKAEANAALAGRQRDLALETLEKLVYEIQTHLKDRPGLHALREDLLAGAIDGLDRVARDKDFRPDLSTLNARTLLGEIYLGLGRTEDARRQLERSRGLAESLIADDPENALARRELGRALCKLGAVHLRMGDAASARALHEKAAALHRALLPIDPQPPLAQWDLLLACSNLGDALIQLGEPAKAREQYTEALKFAEALTAADPSNVDYQIHQASCRERLGEVCLRLGDPVAALDHHRKALAQREELARERPGSLFIRRQVMTSCRQIGDLHFKRGDLTAAEPMYRRAYELCTATLQVDPQYFQVRFDLALCWERLGDIRQQRYDYPEAERYYRQALEEYERLAAADSANVQPRRGASVAHEKLGRVCRRRGHWQAALDHGRQAVRQREALARANPENVETQTDLAAAYGNLALAALEAGNFAEAVDHYSRGLDLLQQLEAQGKLKDQPQYQNWLRVFRSRLALSQAAGQAVEDLAFALRQPAEWVPELLLLRVRTLAGRGSHAEAAATAEALRARAPDNATNLYNVACCYALCARGVAAGKAPADLAADESAARTEYIRRAMEALTQAVRRGYRNGLHLRTDPDLAILHDAEGFQELLGQLTQDRRQESGDKDPKP
ncbi:MAG TPA: tetratricopeptide repeat protein, partial [Gemmataceae bacterium]|nr:tetratricopeptide repeat protein [Gemmataceae bacterium]